MNQPAKKLPAKKLPMNGGLGVPILNQPQRTDHLMPGQQRPQPSPAEQAQLAQFLQQLKPKPILTALKDLGVKTRIKATMIDGNMAECLIIPIDELMRKEYLHMSGLSAEDFEVEK